MGAKARALDIDELARMLDASPTEAVFRALLLCCTTLCPASMAITLRHGRSIDPIQTKAHGFDLDRGLVQLFPPHRRQATMDWRSIEIPLTLKSWIDPDGNGPWLGQSLTRATLSHQMNLMRIRGGFVLRDASGLLLTHPQRRWMLPDTDRSVNACSIRYGMITLLLSRGLSLNEVRAFLGHAPPFWLWPKWPFHVAEYRARATQMIDEIMIDIGSRLKVWSLVPPGCDEERAARASRIQAAGIAALRALPTTAHQKAALLRSLAEQGPHLSELSTQKRYGPNGSFDNSAADTSSYKVTFRALTKAFKARRP
jgi:hypothetical protein